MNCQRIQSVDGGPPLTVCRGSPARRGAVDPQSQSPYLAFRRGDHAASFICPNGALTSGSSAGAARINLTFRKVL
jgi:hypothetical protein